MTEGPAVFFDGHSNRKRQVQVRLGAALEIVEDGRIAAAWPYGDVRRVDSAPGLLRLMCITAPGLARLEIHDPALQQAIETHCPALRVTHRSAGQTLRIVVYSAAALASFIGLLIYGIPLLADRLAAVIPLSFERRLGQAVDNQLQPMLGARACEGAEGRKALERMVVQLGEAARLTAEFDVRVLSPDIPNALALPGGKIYVLNGLLQKAKEPDELAGVLAHELGHLQNRDGLRKLLADGGTGLLLGLLFGDVFGGSAIIFATRSVLSGSYSREAERSADAFSAEVMRKLGRSPKAVGELLLRITGPEAGKGMTILASHPLTEERLATMTRFDERLKEERLAAIARGQQPVTHPELLSREEWAALQAICR